jgi:CRP-like cAMP-binding protein
MQNNAMPETHASRVKEYRTGAVIAAEGEKEETFYVILQGSVALFQHNKSLRALTAGDVFGLERVFLKKSLTTTAWALSPVRIAVYQKNAIAQIAEAGSQVITTIIVSLVNQLEQTTQIAEEYMPPAFILDCNQRVYRDGETIIEEGTSGNDIFMLLESERGLLVTRKGKEVGCITRPGEYFGEMSGLLGEKRTATVHSLGTSLVQRFPGDDLEAALMAYPRLAKQIIDTLASRLLAANRRIVDLSGTKEAETNILSDSSKT